MKNNSQKLRIILNDYAYIEGGASNVAISHANELHNKGYEVILIAGHSVEGKHHPFKHIPLSVSAKPKKHQRNVFNYIFNLKVLFQIKKILHDAIKDYEDIKVYIHSWTKILSPSVFYSLITFNDRIKVDIVSHDYFLDCPNGGYFNFKQNRICKLKPMSVSCALTNCDRISYSRKVIRLLRSFIQLKILGKLVFNIRYVSEFQKRNIIYAHSLAKNISVVPNITYQTQKPIPNVHGKDAVSDFVFVGRFEKEKGIIQLLDALSLSGTTCIFCGDGTLRNLIEACDNAVVSERWLGKEDINRFLINAKAIIIPSLWYEADPLTSLEAASLSVPRIVSVYCAAANDVTDMKDGLLIDPFNVFSFSAILRDVVDGKLDMPTIALNASSSFTNQIAERRKINEEFDW